MQMDTINMQRMVTFMHLVSKKLMAAYYGFNANGIMYAGEEFQLLNNYYRAREDGSLYVSQWYQNEWENGTIMMKTEKVFEMELQKLMAKNISLVQEYCM